MSENEIIVREQPKTLSLGALPTTGPVALIQAASGIASELANIIKAKGLSSRIQGREFVHVEGWSTMGAMLGVLPREVDTQRLEDGSYEATVELIRINDGAIIGRASALCGMDEKDRRGKLTWGNRAEYARRSMAVTRATGKAYRLGFSWIMALAGYEPTPMEEIIDGTFEETKAAKSAKAKDEPPPHWIKDPAARKRFWAWTNGLTLTKEQVHAALEVEHVEDYAGAKQDAMDAINKWIAEQDQADAEPSPFAEAVEDLYPNASENIVPPGAS